MDDKKPIAIIAVVLVLLTAGGIWWYSRPEPAANATPRAVAATDAPIDKPAAVTLPPLDQMDAFLRSLLSALSSRPEMAAWLATDDLVRQMAMALNQTSQGNSPARDFKAIKPAGTFSTTGRGTRRTIDPRSYQRYDSLVTTITSIDATAAARAYKTIKPRLEEAYRGLGTKNTSVDAAMQTTLDIMLDTPTAADPVDAVESGAAGWAFANQTLEDALPLQKQLLRTGPANTEKLKNWLRAFRDAL
jgi:hypothetical protein